MTLSVGLGPLAKPAQVFVACLAYSGYLWADVTWTQQAEDWLGSNIRLVEHLGGVPARLVPDNLKVGVSHASFYDPAINPAYHDLARHYGTAVIPTRVRRPRDKPSVENGVQQVERRVLAPLRNRQFATLDEARAAVAERVRTVNGAPMKWETTPANRAPAGMRPRSSMYRLMTRPRSSSGTISISMVLVLARNSI